MDNCLLKKQIVTNTLNSHHFWTVKSICDTKVECPDKIMFNVESTIKTTIHVELTHILNCYGNKLEVINNFSLNLHFTR